MRWIRYAGAPLLMVVAQAAVADVIVVRSNGPSATRYPPGKRLPDNARLKLQKDDQIVLLDARGTRTLSGAGDFPATAAPSAAAPSTAAAIASTATSRRQRVGATRSMSAMVEPTFRPGIFLVDVAAPGKVCVVDTGAVTLWRGNSRVPATTTLTGSDGATATINWIAGQATQPWPATLPVRQGARYQLSSSTSAMAMPLQFEALGSRPADLQQLAAALIARGCQNQVDVLVATTPPSPTPETGG